MAKETGIRILMIEDELADMMLVNRELRTGGLTFSTERVASKEGFLHELEHEPPDLILSDHGLPSFDGFTALAIARDRCPEVPFIFVTDSLGEEKAIEAFERGAAGCVLKKHLAKLVPAVQRALREAEERRSRKWAEADRERMLRKLHEAVAKANTVSGLLPICSHCKKIRDGDDHWQALEIYFREHFNVEFTHGLCPQCVPVFFPGQMVNK